MRHHSWARRVLDFLVLNLGVLLVALSFDLFLVPNRIAAGGLSGVATILFYLFRAPVGLVMLILNVPLFVWGIVRLGWGFALRSLYATVVLSLATDLLASVVAVPTHDLLLAALFGGVLSGLGLGLTFRVGSTTGGSDFAAVVLQSYMSINVGQLLFALNAAVVLAALVVFRSPELAMYALITIFVESWVVDAVQEGLGYAKTFFIISEHSEKVQRAIIDRLGRGATVLAGRGAYTGQDRQVILTVVARSEVTRLKSIMHEVDPLAFVIVADAREVLGEGFTMPVGARQGARGAARAAARAAGDGGGKPKVSV